MSYRDIMKQENESIKERYALASERIESMLYDGISIKEKPLFDYFIMTAGFLMNIKETLSIVEAGLDRLSLDGAGQLNEGLYSYIRKECFRRPFFAKACPADCISEGKAEDFRRDSGLYGMCYDNSFANPQFALSRLGEKYGPMLCFLFAEFQSLIAYTFEQRLFDITIAMELFIEIYNCFEMEEEPYEAVKSAIYYHFKDYSEEMMDRRVREITDPSLGFATEIVMESDLSDPRYLYRYGEYITRNELALAEFLNSLPKTEIESIAATFTGGFYKGFELKNKSLAGKKSVNIRYRVGFERIVREVVKQLGDAGLLPVIYRAPLSSFNRGPSKTGYYSTSANRQFDFDHRFDEAMFLKKSFLEKKLAATRRAFEKYADQGAAYAGPAVLDAFGEEDFVPVIKAEALRLSQKQQRLSTWFQRQNGLLSNEFVKPEQTSFTIMALPLPDIGEQFEEIFRDTVKVNTLDQGLYERIQQTLIDALDKGSYVHIKGAGGNRTDLKVMLGKLSDPSKQTNFNNCLAAVNIPVGEVFTSPVLAGTEGLLHVKEVYLRDLQYRDLALTFRNGRISDYTCGNFESGEDNSRFIKENLLNHNETLPLGEFAIGTNTMAYRMGRRYGISRILPILIAEKMGPHFAVGDTCYQRCEDLAEFNSDGKEVVARDNECSLLRKSDVEKAYFGCHTDITIPYEELGEITVCGPDGLLIPLIKDGRFVLEGTQELNRPLDE